MNARVANASRQSITNSRKQSNQSEARPRTDTDLAANVYLDQADKLPGNFPWSMQKQGRHSNSQARIKFGTSQGQLLRGLHNTSAASDADFTASAGFADVFRPANGHEPAFPYGGPAQIPERKKLVLKRGPRDSANDQVVLSFANGAKTKSQFFVTPTTATGTDKEKASDHAWNQAGCKEVSSSNPQL